MTRTHDTEKVWLRAGRMVCFLALILPVGLAACGDDGGDGGDTPDAANNPGPDGGDTSDAANNPGPDGGGGADANTGPDPEPAGLEGITLRHNEVRATVGVAPLVWDPDLAAVAQAWADQCIDQQPPAGLIDHNDGRSDNYPGYVGENVYGSSGQATGDGAVSAWAAEAPNYDYETNTCAQGAVCGHYTQIVWAASERLGCGINDCAGLTYGSTIVCNYSPGGNNGDRPY